MRKNTSLGKDTWTEVNILPCTKRALKKEEQSNGDPLHSHLGFCLFYLILWFMKHGNWNVPHATKFNKETPQKYSNLRGDSFVQFCRIWHLDCGIIPIHFGDGYLLLLEFRPFSKNIINFTQISTFWLNFWIKYTANNHRWSFISL